MIEKEIKRDDRERDDREMKETIEKEMMEARDNKKMTVW